MTVGGEGTFPGQTGDPNTISPILLEAMPGERHRYGHTVCPLLGHYHPAVFESL